MTEVSEKVTRWMFTPKFNRVDAAFMCLAVSLATWWGFVIALVGITFSTVIEGRVARQPGDTNA